MVPHYQCTSSGRYVFLKNKTTKSDSLFPFTFKDSGELLPPELAKLLGSIWARKPIRKNRRETVVAVICAKGIYILVWISLRNQFGVPSKLLTLIILADFQLLGKMYAGESSEFPIQFDQIFTPINLRTWIRNLLNLKVVFDSVDRVVSSLALFITEGCVRRIHNVFQVCARKQPKPNSFLRQSFIQVHHRK